MATSESSMGPLSLEEELEAVLARLRHREAQVAAVYAVIEEHEDCGGGCIARLLLAEVKDAVGHVPGP